MTTADHSNDHFNGDRPACEDPVYWESLCEKHSIMYHGACPLCEDKKASRKVSRK